MSAELLPADATAPPSICIASSHPRPRATWVPVTSASLGSASLTAAAFSSPTNGVIGDTNGRILRADARTAIAVGTHAFVLRSTDGGATWSEVSAATPQAPDLDAVAFATPTLGYSLSGTLIRRTEDGGRTWSEPFPHLPTRFAALGFADAKNGLIGGSFSSIVRTTTSGD
ncbi:MAG: hypothetical protein ABIQ16_00825 [Polyangiaceae bacterium]